MSNTSKPKPVLELVEFRGEYRGITTFCQMTEGELLPVGLEILGEANRMSEKLGEAGRVSALLVGHNISGKNIETLIHHGARKIIFIDQPDFEIYNTRVYASAIVEMVKKHKPEMIGRQSFS